MADIRVALDEILPIKEAARTLARAVDRLERAEAPHLVITRRSRPSAVLVAIDRYRALLKLESEAAA
jgi:prevent-host-death family protein